MANAQGRNPISPGVGPEPRIGYAGINKPGTATHSYISSDCPKVLQGSWPSGCHSAKTGQAVAIIVIAVDKLFVRPPPWVACKI